MNNYPDWLLDLYDMQQKQKHQMQWLAQHGYVYELELDPLPPRCCRREMGFWGYDQNGADMYVCDVCGALRPGWLFDSMVYLDEAQLEDYRQWKRTRRYLRCRYGTEAVTSVRDYWL